MPSSGATSGLYQLDAFRLPQPENRGSTARNLNAFKVLQNAFVKARSEQLACVALDAILTVYSSDDANYFLLEELHTLTRFAEVVGSKPEAAQVKFYGLLEFLVQRLKYVPTKELIALSLFLKANENRECIVLALSCLVNVLRSDVLFKDVYREIGE